MINEKKVAVIALDRNAILKPGQRETFEEQMANVAITCEQLAQMVESRALQDRHYAREHARGSGLVL